MGIDRNVAEAFARALGHSPASWERQRVYMADLFVPEHDAGAAELPLVSVLTCRRCGAQLADDAALALRSELLSGWCPWLLILIPERRAEAAARYVEWWRSLGYEPRPWSGGDEPPPGPAEVFLE